MLCFANIKVLTLSDANDETGAGTNETQSGTSSNANEEVVTITNGKFRTCILFLWNN